MYYLFKPASQLRTDGELAATLAYDGEFVPETEPYWWEATPLTVPPPHLVFAVDATVPLLDNYHTASIFDLYSMKLVRLLATARVRFEVFPVTIVDYRTYVPVSVEYAAFHVLEEYQATDAETVQRRWPPRERPFLLSPATLARARPFFRMAESCSRILIHQDLKHVLEAERITGCQYIPLDEARW